MCGVFGWITTKPAVDAEQRLDAALRLLVHRGPDGQGQWFSRAQGTEIAFGHRRLSIIDLSTGDQPMHSGDDRFVVTFNGEIYNYIELAEELRAKGHVFRTTSDTEVLLEAYRAWGVDCLTRLRGMFAFALYDRQTGDVVMARDPFGKKPLFLADIPGGIAFSSEIAPLLDMPGVDCSLRTDVVGEYLLSRYVAGPETLLKGVRKLPPGHVLTWRNGRAETRRYFTPPFLRTLPTEMPMAEAVERFSFAIDEAVRIRLRSDAPFGAFLSGGLDSSLIVALMSRHCSAPLNTFTVGFEDQRVSELRHAQAVASHFGTKHNEVVVTSADFFDSWDDAVRFRGAPVSEASDIPILILSRMARSKVKMVLTGEGADELLGGYPKYQAERFIRRYQTLVPAGLHRALIAPVVGALPYGFRRLKILSQALGAGSFQEREATWFASGPVGLISRLVRRDVHFSNATDQLELPPSMSAPRALQLNDQMAWLSDNLLERGDRMMMAGSIEGRMPFMDVKLAEEVARIPDRFLSGGRGKMVARAAGAHLLGRETIARRKNGFAVPLGQWFRTEQRTRLMDLIGSGSSKVGELLDRAVLDDILREHMSGRQNYEKLLWAIANLELFMREFGNRSERLSPSRRGVAVG